MGINKVTRYFTNAFILNKTKLYRLCEVTNKRFKLISGANEIKTIYEVELKKGKKHSISNIESLFDLDNSLINPITKLSIQWEFEDEDYNSTTISVDFSAAGSLINSSIAVTGSSPSFNWLNETVGEIEEQLERCYLSGLIYKIKNKYAFSHILALTIAFVLLFFSIFIEGEQKDQRFELSDKELIYLSSIAEKAKTNDEKIDAIFQTIGKLYLKKSDKLKLYELFVDIRLYFIISPLLIILISWGYLYKKCYPLYVFEWGDCEENYKKLVDRKKFLWNVIIGSLVIGIFGNLFVYGFSIFSK
ncbi:MAG: hypothetical protein GY874_17905 [Desulfobacteraceae bacterium]|nr:hypothetical protein [Desulfobacteraceae bacterium]